MAEVIAVTWSFLKENGWHVFDTFVSFSDVIIFIIVAILLCWLIGALMGGGD